MPQIVNDWKTKADSLSQELDTSQRECRFNTTLADKKKMTDTNKKSMTNKDAKTMTKLKKKKKRGR